MTSSHEVRQRGLLSRAPLPVLLVPLHQLLDDGCLGADAGGHLQQGASCLHKHNNINTFPNLPISRCCKRRGSKRNVVKDQHASPENMNELVANAFESWATCRTACNLLVLISCIHPSKSERRQGDCEPDTSIASISQPSQRTVTTGLLFAYQRSNQAFADFHETFSETSMLQHGTNSDCQQ
jgi:hypothetical protein